MITIYKISNIINGKVYIGKTKQKLNIRLREHISKLNQNKHYNKFLQNSWNKYSESSFLFETIEICDANCWQDREIYWISFYKSRDESFGYNLTTGGEGGGGRTPSENEKELLRIRNKERVWTEEARLRQSIVCKKALGNYWTEENRKLQGERSRNYPKRGGWKLSEEAKLKIRAAMKDFKHSQETKDKLKLMRLSTSKGVKCIETNTTYVSLKEAGRAIGTCASNIRSHLQGKLNKVKGLTFIWN